TRRQLLQGLREAGFGTEQLREMQQLIDAENCDLFDVLAHIAYASEPRTREERATKARRRIITDFDAKQQAFLHFVLEHYVNVGEHELDPSKLPPLLKLRYHDSIADAVADLGSPESISELFTGFQKYLYQEVG